MDGQDNIICPFHLSLNGGGTKILFLFYFFIFIISSRKPHCALTDNTKLIWDNCPEICKFNSPDVSNILNLLTPGASARCLCYHL